VLFEHGPQQFDADIIVGIQKAAVDLGYAPIRLTSGAFHDALFVAETCRTAMIFVPCKDGISHHPDEYSSPIQLADGTKVLTATVYSLVNEQARRMNQP
jgi:N-carbamoyl-L-amino-acid hydrolase